MLSVVVPVPVPVPLPEEDEPLAVTASALYMALSVDVPACPSALRPLALWKAMTALSVAVPNLPSALPDRKPSSIRRLCMAFTELFSMSCLRVTPIDEEGVEAVRAEE